MDIDKLTIEKINILENSKEINDRVEKVANGTYMQQYDTSVGSWTRDFIRAFLIVNFFQEKEFLKKLNQRFDDYIDDTELLEQVCKDDNIFRLKAEKAKGAVKIFGTAGAEITAGMKVKKRNFIYIITENKRIASNSAIVKVEAENPGSEFNANVGEINTFFERYEGLANVQNEEKILSGKDEETEDELIERRHKILQTPFFFQNQFWYEKLIKEKFPEIEYIKCLPRTPGKGHVKILIAKKDIEILQANEINEIKSFLENQLLSDVILHIENLIEKSLKLEINYKRNENYSAEESKKEIFETFEEYFKDNIFNTTEILFYHIADYLFQNCDSIIEMKDFKINDKKENIKFNINEKIVVNKTGSVVLDD